jgi:hypothetical protein
MSAVPRLSLRKSVACPRVSDPGRGAQPGATAGVMADRSWPSPMGAKALERV